MKRATKRKPVPVEPLPPAPIQMGVQEPAAPATSTCTQSSPEIDAPMSPEKTEVTRLYARANQANECVNGLRQAMRYCKRDEVCIKGAMYMKKRKQDRVPKARTKAELAERAADEQLLAECKANYEEVFWYWACMCVDLADAREKALLAENARLKRLLRDAGGEW